MRQIGTVPDEENAQRFEDYALTLGIKTRIEQDNGQWAVWVYDEDQLAQGRQELDQFQQNPHDPRYVEAVRPAEALRKQDEQHTRQYRRNVVDVRRRWNRSAWRQAPATYAMIAFSVLVVLISTDWQTPLNFCNKLEPLLKYLYFLPVEPHGEDILWWPGLGLKPVLQGQFWRLFTPIFIHFGPLHLLFNMLWLRDLGAIIERNRGLLRFVVLILLIAGVSNLTQYYWTEREPWFGGMSGVVFGLFGYIWMKSRFDPTSGFFIHPNVVFLMLLYLAITLAGALSIPIAHGAHVGGLIVGAAVGYMSSRWRTRRRSAARVG